MVNGILLINKPKGWTSFDVVAKVRGLLKKEGVAKPKVGHCGTLDPQATGLLVLVIGNYTKRAQEFSKLDKTYEVETELGKTSTTGDSEGEISKVSDTKPDKQEVLDIISSFVGEIEQTPPIFSAIKVNGKRAYELAREGKEVKLEPRAVTIYSITDVDYDYPIVRFTTRVSSGTYIRSLVEDIGKELSTGAYMSNLNRSKVDNMEQLDAINVDKLSFEQIQNSLRTK